MGNILKTLLQRSRLVRFENCDGQVKKMARAATLQELKDRAREKLGIKQEDDISVVETATGHEVDEDCFDHLPDDIQVTVLNVSKGETWDRLQVLPIHSLPPNSLSPEHQVTRDASGSLTINYIVSIQAQSVQLGDYHQILCTRGSNEPTQDEDIEL